MVYFCPNQLFLGEEVSIKLSQIEDQLRRKKMAYTSFVARVLIEQRYLCVPRVQNRFFFEQKNVKKGAPDDTDPFGGRLQDSDFFLLFLAKTRIINK